MSLPRTGAAVFLSAAALIFSALTVPAGATLPAGAARSAVPTSAWSPPEAIGSNSDWFDLAVSQSGDSVVVWRDGSRVRASYRSGGRDWESPVRLGDADLTSRPHVIVDGDGDATVSWQHADALILGSRPAGTRQTWRREDVNPGGHATVSNLRVAGNVAGQLLVAFRWSSDASGDGATALSEARDGSWQEIPGLSYKSGPIAVTGRHAVAAVWSNKYAVRASVAKLHGGWSRPLRIIHGTGTRPSITAGDRGDLAVASPSDSGVRIAVKPRTRQWQDEYVVPHSAPAGDVALDVDDRGRVTVAYVLGRPGRTRVMAVRRTARGHWLDPVRLSQKLPAAYGVDLAADELGNVVATWATDSTGGDDTVQAAFAASHGGWQTAVTLGTPVTATEERRVATPVVSAGTATFTVAYTAEHGVVTRDLVLDSAAPTARLTRPRVDHQLRKPISIAWRSRDDLAGVRDVDVRMRRGRYDSPIYPWSPWRSDLEVDHVRFRSAGEGNTYCFSVRARDRAANVGRWSHRRCISNPVDDRSMDPSKGWHKRRQTGAYLDTLTVTRRHGQRIALPLVWAEDLRLVAQTCAGCGKVSVRFDGRRLGVFDLSTPHRRNKRQILVGRFDQPVHGRVVVRVVSHGEPVRIDGILASR